MSFGRIEEVLCWTGSATGVGSALLNAVLINATARILVFVVMAISCIACGAWAWRTKNKAFLVAEMIYLGIAVLGIATHMGYLTGVL
jgi:hypothetical protein